MSELDQPAEIISLEIQITEASDAKTKKPADPDSPEGKTPENPSAKKPSEKTEAENLLVHAELSTINNQPAQLKIGGQEPRVSGTSQSSMGRSNSISLTNVGTMISMTPRVAGGGMVCLQLDLSDSRFGPIEEGAIIYAPASGPQVRSSAIETLQTQTTLRLQDGQPLTISGLTSSGKTRHVTVTAHVISPGATKTAQ